MIFQIHQVIRRFRAGEVPLHAVAVDEFSRRGVIAGVRQLTEIVEAENIMTSSEIIFKVNELYRNWEYLQPGLGDVVNQVWNELHEKRRWRARPWKKKI